LDWNQIGSAIYSFLTSTTIGQIISISGLLAIVAVVYGATQHFRRENLARPREHHQMKPPVPDSRRTKGEVTSPTSQNEIVVGLRKFIKRWQQFKEYGEPREFLDELTEIALNMSTNMRMLESKSSSTWSPEYRAKVKSLIDELQRFGKSYTGSLDVPLLRKIVSMGESSYRASCDLVTMTYEKV
jgi:hypothetical protein